MENLTPPNSTNVSPKRKRLREALEDGPVRSSPNAPTFPSSSHAESLLAGTKNSRSVVAVRFKKVGLPDSGPTTRLEFGNALHGSVPVIQGTPAGVTVDSCTSLTTREPHPLSMNTHDPAITSRLGTWDARSSPKPEIPETPQRKPILSPSSSLDSITSPAHLLPNLWWQPAEITGQDLDDPNDDGYGINGIGFVPTPAVTRARTEGRRRQIAAWKLREAREARQRRSDRRRHRNIECGGAGNIIAGLPDDETKQGRKVRFLGA